jgi:hypothetical protein
MADLPTLHRDLLAALDEIETLIAQPQVDRVRLSRVRLTISKLAGERRIEADRLCRDLSRSASSTAGLMLEALRVSNIEARLEYTRHVGAWSLVQAEKDWPGYCRDSVKLAARFRQQIAAEQALLYATHAKQPTP